MIGGGHPGPGTLPWDDGRPYLSCAALQALNQVAGPESAAPARDGTWLSYRGNIFVLRSSPDSYKFGCTEPEASFVGLALECLHESMRLWRGWESVFVTRGLELEFRGSSTVHRSLMDVFTDCYSFGGPHLYVFVRRHIVDNDAQGRGHPLDHAISLATHSPGWEGVWQDGIRALAALRDWAFLYLANGGVVAPFPDPAADFTGRVWGLVDRLLREAELILHESGHTLATTEIAGAVTGVAADWYQGHSNSNASFDVRPYRFPGDADANQSPHNGLQVAGSWIECLMRQNRGPRDRMTRNACRCGKTDATVRRNPRYGGWGRDDLVCAAARIGGFTLLPRTCS